MAVTANQVSLDVVVAYEGGQQAFRSEPVAAGLFAPDAPISGDEYFHEVEIGWPAGTARVDVTIENGDGFQGWLPHGSRRTPGDGSADDGRVR
jgi:hypothetical protein